ncbi:transposase [Escherichia coli]
MELQDWRKEPRKKYSNEFKLRMVELASQPGACVAQIARKRKLTAVCSHQTRIGNLDAHLI